MSAGDPGAPIDGSLPIVTRWRDGGGGLCDPRTVALFASVRRPAPLGGATVARIRDRLDVTVRAPTRGTVHWHRMAAVAAAFVFGAVSAGALHSLVALRDHAAMAGVRVAVLGVGSASSDAAGRVRVESGRVAVRTGDRSVQVDAPSGRLLVAAASVVEIDSAEERVACYQGSATVAWTEGPLLTLGAGFSATRSSTEEAPAARRDEVMRALRGAAAESPSAPSERRVAELAQTNSRIAGGDAVEPVRPGAESPAPAVRVAQEVASMPAPPALPVADGARSSPVPSAPRGSRARLAPSDPVEVIEKQASTPLPAAQVQEAEPAEAVSEPAESNTAAEYHLVADAMRLLRREHRPLEALATLDDYARRFPDRHLGREADTVRVEVLMALSRKSEALAILDRKVAAGVAVDRALHVLRGELLAAAGRCREALTEATPAADSDDALGERASYVSAVCHVKLGHAAQGRLALVGYLRRFPSGRYVDEVRRALGR